MDIFFFFPCRISVQMLKCMRLCHRQGLARRYFRATVMWQLQVTLEPNWAATPRPTVPSTRVTWTICFEAGLTTSNCCHVTGYMGAGWHVCLNTQQSLPCTRKLGAWQTKRQLKKKEETVRSNTSCIICRSYLLSVKMNAYL